MAVEMSLCRVKTFGFAAGVSLDDFIEENERSLDGLVQYGSAFSSNGDMLTFFSE